MMDDQRSSTPAQGAAPQLQNGGRRLYRMHSNASSTSIFENVEMAHDEVSKPAEPVDVVFPFHR